MDLELVKRLPSRKFRAGDRIIDDIELDDILRT